MGTKMYCAHHSRTLFSDPVLVRKDKNIFQIVVLTATQFNIFQLYNCRTMAPSTCGCAYYNTYKHHCKVRHVSIDTDTKQQIDCMQKLITQIEKGFLGIPVLHC